MLRDISIIYSLENQRIILLVVSDYYKNGLTFVYEDEYTRVNLAVVDLTDNVYIKIMI